MKTLMQRQVLILTVMCLSVLTTVMAGSARVAHAQTDSQVQDVSVTQDDIWTRDKLTGDWWGARKYLADHGININLRLSQYLQYVGSGGVEQNGDYGGTMDYRVNANLTKLFHLWEGLSVDMHARTRFGGDVGADAGAFVIPNAGMLMPVPGDYGGTDITGLTVSQSFPLFRGRLGVLIVGKLDVIDLVTGFFPSVGYGQEGFWNVNSLVSALPWFGSVQGLSLYGGELVSINQKYQTAESGVVIAGTANVSTSWSISDSFDDGVFLAAFQRIFWDLDDKMGYFMVFVGGSTREQASNDPNDFVVIPGQGLSTKQKNPWDIALYIYQEFWQAAGDPNRKAKLMIGGTVGPDNPQFAQWNFFANVEAFGPIAVRPHDRMGVSGWYNGLSNNFVDDLEPLDIFLRDTWGFEMYYNLAFSNWFHLSPDIQLAKNQNKGDDLAVIFGLRWVLDF
jgi:porin